MMEDRPWLGKAKRVEQEWVDFQDPESDTHHGEISAEEGKRHVEPMLGKIHIEKGEELEDGKVLHETLGMH